MIGDEFQCSVCKGTFTHALSDEEMRDAYRARTGREPQSSDVFVCADCHNLLMAWRLLQHITHAQQAANN